MAIRTPDSSYEDDESNATVAVKQIENKCVVVLYAKGETNRIITVYHASDVDRLIRLKLQRGAWVTGK